MTDRKWRAAWLVVGSEFAKIKTTHARGANSVRPTNDDGLCTAFCWANGMSWNSPLGKWIKHLLEKFSEGEVKYDSLWWFPTRDHWSGEHTREHDDYRVLFACLFSNMTVKEFEEICQ